MAVSISNGVRVRLSFTDSCRYTYESSLYTSVWYLVNIDRLKTIEGLALEICRRFNISSNLRVELSHDGCLLPHWETTAILRDNDLVNVAAVDEAVCKKRRSSESYWERSISLENSRKNKKKKRRVFEEGEENDLAPIVAAPKEKKRRNEVKSMEIVEGDAVKYDDTDCSKEKRRNRQKQDTETLDLSDFLCDANFMQCSTTAVKNRSCRVSLSENLTHEPNRLQLQETGADVANRNEQTNISPFVGPLTSSASALVEDEVRFGENFLVSNGVEETSSQLNEVDLVVAGLPVEVKKKAKRIRRSRKNRKEKNLAMLDPEFKSSNVVCPDTLELPPKDLQNSSVRLQKMDWPWFKTSAYSHPQHVVFDDNDDPGSGASDRQNVFTDSVADGLPIHSVANGAERVPGSKGESPVADKGLSSYEREINCHPLVHYEEQVTQLNKSITGSLLQSASVEDQEYNCRLMSSTSSDSRGLSHEKKPRQIRSVTNLSPFANVQVFKRQRGTTYQLPSTAERVLTSKGNQIRAPTCTKHNMPEDVTDVATCEAIRDYSMYELLLGPPRPGDVIAYKILQLSADYSPALSSYKEAKVLKFTPATRIVELEPKNMKTAAAQVKKLTGKFELTIEDDNEIFTNSVMQDDKLISISWDLLLEPRLVA